MAKKLRVRNCFGKTERRIKFEYHYFIKSHWWKIQKIDWYYRNGKKCAVCKSDKYINLHHKYYPKNGRYLNMLDGYLVALCKKCHFKYHKEFGVQQDMSKTTNLFIRRNRLR